MNIENSFWFRHFLMCSKVANTMMLLRGWHVDNFAQSFIESENCRFGNDQMNVYFTMADRFFSELHCSEEAEKRNPQKGMRKFSELFYLGGKIELKKDVEGTWKEKAYMYARALMGSWSPKHEHKELVVGMKWKSNMAKANFHFLEITKPLLI